LDADDFSDSVIKIMVYDADSLTRNDLIGSYNLDAMYIYQQPNHELWKQWAGLINEQVTKINLKKKGGGGSSWGVGVLRRFVVVRDGVGSGS
jgi:hypothetical protein